METYKCSEVIHTCKYGYYVSNGEMYCDYIEQTGHRRGCNPEECDKYQKGKVRRVVKRQVANKLKD